MTTLTAKQMLHMQELARTIEPLLDDDCPDWDTLSEFYDNLISMYTEYAFAEEFSWHEKAQGWYLWRLDMYIYALNPAHYTALTFLELMEYVEGLQSIFDNEEHIYDISHLTEKEKTALLEHTYDVFQSCATVFASHTGRISKLFILPQRRIL